MFRQSVLLQGSQICVAIVLDSGSEDEEERRNDSANGGKCKYDMRGPKVILEESSYRSTVNT